MIPCDSQPEVARVLGTLHAKKSAVYGDSWRKRGELLSIFPNIARKYDRLEIAVESGELDLAARGALDRTVEPLVDTLADLAIYAAKYLTFLAESQPNAFSTQASAATCADFEGALRTVLARKPAFRNAREERSDVRTLFGKIAVAMQRLEALLVGPPTEYRPGEKAETVVAIAGGSLVLLERLADASPELWSASVREVDAS
jgi:hypothetical protein